MSKTQRINTGRSAQFADNGGGSSNGLALTFSEINYTGGVEGFGAIADVTGVTISFNLPVSGLVQFFGSGASLANPFIQGNYLGLAINVNGTDYELNGTGVQGFNAVGGGNLVTGGFTGGNAISGQRALDLAAGSYTVKLRAFGNGYLESSASFPTRLTAVYPTVTGEISTASPLAKQETGPFAATVNPAFADTYDPIPSSSLVVNLASPQVIMLLAYSTFVDPGSNVINAQLGVRVTSPGPSVVDYDGSRLGGGNDMNRDTSMLSRAVQLGIGSHTIELIAKNPASGGTYEYENAFLTAVYTVPQVITTGIDVLANFHSDTDIPPDGLQQTICSLPFIANFAQSILIDFSAFNMVVHKGNNITVTYKIDSGTEKNGCRVNLENLSPTFTTDEPFGANGAFRRYEAVSAGAHTLHVFANVEIDNPSPSDGVGGIKAPIDVLILGK